MSNVRAWWLDEEEPNYVTPEQTEVHIGPNPGQRCTLDVESIRVHPNLNAVREGNVIDYDFSLFQLTESVLDVCDVDTPRA